MDECEFSLLNVRDNLIEENIIHNNSDFNTYNSNDNNIEWYFGQYQFD